MTERATPVVPAVLGAFSLALCACQPAGDTGASKGEGSAAATPSGGATSARMDALKAQAVALTVADPDCTLREGVERAVQAVDLGEGDVGVIVACSSGMVDTWSDLYVSSDGASPVRAPLIQYDVRGDSQWRDDDTASELTWNAEDRAFESVTRSQASGCATGASWRWDGRRIALVRQWRMTCDGPDGPSDPVTIWPTTPPTPEPSANNAE